MKKAVSMMLVLCMLISCIPANAFAQEPALGAEPVAVAEEPTATPTEEPAEEPTAAPTEEPTAAPTEKPAEEPTAAPTEKPAEEPTAAPTEKPAEEPTAVPTEKPAGEPTAAPTEEPAGEPTAAPTEKPAGEPTAAPTEKPAGEPTAAPTEEPAGEPTAAPTEEPAGEPAAAPTEKPAGEPTVAPDAYSALSAPLLMPLDVTVDTPKAFAVTQFDMTQGYISWAGVSGVDGYEVQRSSSSDFTSGVFPVKPSASATNCTIKMECGKTYYFRMRAYVNTDANNVVYSEWTRTISLATSPDAPDELKGTAITSTSVKLQWPAVSGVTGYIVHRDGVQIGKVGGENNTSYTDEGLVLGTTYTYTLYSYVKLSNGTEIASAKGKELSYICVPPAPKNVTAESAGVSSIRIQWDKVPGVSSYEIYCAPVSGANFRLAGTVMGDSTLSYTDTNRVTGETYQYYVVAVVSATVKSERSETVTGVARAPAPANVKAQYIDSSQIKLTWNAVEDSNGYIIQVSSKRDSGYKELTHGALESCEFMDTGLSTGQRRYYRICAYMGEYGDTNRYGEWSRVVSDATRPKAPSGLKLTNIAFNKLGLTFDASEGAAGYEISQSTDGRTFTVVSRRTDTSYRSGALTVGQTYYYRVRAYTLDTDGVSKLYGKYSTVKSLMVTLLAPSAVNVTRLNARTNGVNVQWSSVFGATGYYIYVNQDGTGSKFLTKTGTETSYKAKNLNQGSSYVYWVRAYRVVDGREVPGLLQKANAITLNIPVVQFTGVTAGAAANSVVVSWGRVYGAEGYHVEVEGKDDDYTLTTDTTQTSIVLNGLSLGNRYTCRVKAYSTVKGKRVEGPEGVKDNISPSAPAPASLSAYTLKQSYGLYLTWEPVSGCSGYRIQRSQMRDSGYTDLVHIEGSENTDYHDTRFTNAEAGNTYYYRVCTYMDNMGVRTYSANTPVRSAMVRAPMPKNLRTTNNNNTSITLHWDAVPYADGYQIYRSDRADGAYSLISRVSGSQTSLNLTGLVVGVDYYFKVRALNMQGNVTVLGTPSNAVYGSPTLAAPNGLTGIAYPKSVRLNWNAVSYASGYKVYISSNGGVNYQEVGSTTGRSYEVKNLQCGSTYLFKVAAYRSAGGNTYTGVACAPLSKRTGLTAPGGVSVAAVDSSKIQISWKAMRDVDGYEIHRAMSIDGAYTLAGDVNAGTLKLVNNVDRTGYPYCYKVRAYVWSNGSRYYGAFSAPVAGRALPNAPKDLVASRVWRLSITINWTETDNAAGYKVFYRQKGATAWNMETLADPNITQHIISGLKSNTTYQIIVKPICYNENGVIINGKGQTNTLTVRTKK